MPGWRREVARSVDERGEPGELGVILQGGLKASNEHTILAEFRLIGDTGSGSPLTPFRSGTRPR
jgi:hypothetical protein